MIVYFIRHGRPEYPTDEFGRALVYGPTAGLSPEGSGRIVKAAQAILQREGIPFDKLITSPFERAKQTAKMIAEVMQIAPEGITEDARLRDTDSTWAGESIETFLKAWNERKVFDDPHTIETLDAIRQRMRSAVHDHIDNFKGNMIGFVGHGDPLRAWLLPYQKPFPSYHLLVESTFEHAEGIRAIIIKDRIIETEIIHDLVEMETPFLAKPGFQADFIQSACKETDGRLPDQ